jgi:hypothetical protein
LWGWVCGHPYLERRTLHDLASKVFTLEEWVSSAARDDGPFGEHLRRLWVALDRDPALREVVRVLLVENRTPDDFSFYRLRAGGLLTGDCPERAQARCPLYKAYLQRRLEPSRS